MDANLTFLNLVAEELRSAGIASQPHTQYQALVLSNGLEIASAEQRFEGQHPMLLNLVVATVHPQYFPQGIIEQVVGVGDGPGTQAQMAVRNFIDHILTTVLAAFQESHDPELDFTATAGGRSCLWHPVSGQVGLQGDWGGQAPSVQPYDIVREHLGAVMVDQKFHWIKLYAAIQPSGETYCDCNVNNVDWPLGRQLYAAHIGGWPQLGRFLGMKQFIMIRRCDAYDL